MDRDNNPSKQDQVAISKADLPKASVMALIDKSPIASVISNPRLTDNPIVAVNDAFQVEILNYKKDGTPFQNAVLVAPLFDEEGELEYFLGSQVEIDAAAPSLAKPRRMRAVAIVKDLSKRQREVLQYIAKGLLNKQIAHELGLSERTVKMHRSILMKRLDVPSAADMVRLAVEAGM